MTVCVKPGRRSRRTLVRFIRNMVPMALTALLLVLAGCSGGNDGPARFPIAGSVNFDGKPVMDGEIFFQPDESAGNSGPASVAPIKNSEYSLPAELGLVGGPYLVKITAYEVPKNPTGPMGFRGPPLFPDYSSKVEFPKEESTHDFDVPATK